MCRLLITDDDVEEAEAAILGEGLHFNAEQRAFIKCLDTIDLTACPGSGKTTSLVAKLYILAKYEVWNGGNPICVVSHTRIAVDEIKEKVASHFPKIMDYPNFIGTIQQFADRYLAIPYYKSFGFDEIKAIDDEIFLNKWKTMNVWSLHAYLMSGGGCQTEEDYNKKITNIIYHQDEEEKIDPADLSLRATSSNSYKQALAAKEELFKSGYLTYTDTRVLALQYIRHYPNVGEILRRRFSYVFLDEAQDTSAEQMEILEQFASSDCYQRVGDPLQTIFNADSEIVDVWQLRDQARHMKLSLGNRFGPKIADFVNHVGRSLSENSSMTSTKDDVYQKCVLILFDDDSPLRVMDWFKIYVEQELAFLDTKSVYVIGAVGKEKQDKLTIKSYAKHYKNDRYSKSDYYQTNLDYFSDIDRDSINRLGSNLIYNRLSKLFISGLREANLSLSTTEIKQKLVEEGQEIPALVIEIAIALNTNRQIPFDNITATLKSEAKKLFNIENVSYEFDATSENTQTENTLGEDELDNNMFEISTIHGIKGQTHDATLLVTTQFYNTGASKKTGEIGGTDLDYLLHEPASLRDTRRRRLLYVSASRPRFLFAWAIPKSKKNKTSSIQSLFTEVIEI